MKEQQREELRFSLLLAWHRRHPHASELEYNQACYRIDQLLDKEQKEKRLEVV